MKTLLDGRNKRNMLQTYRGQEQTMGLLFFIITFTFFLTYSQNCTYYSYFCAIVKTTKCPWWTK